MRCGGVARWRLGSVQFRAAQRVADASSVPEDRALGVLGVRLHSGHCFHYIGTVFAVFQRDRRQDHDNRVLCADCAGCDVHGGFAIVEEWPKDRSVGAAVIF